MNRRKGYYWTIQMRPCTDPSGMSDIIVATPLKSHCKKRAKECQYLIHDIVKERWIKYDKTMLRLVGIHKKKIKGNLK